MVLLHVKENAQSQAREAVARRKTIRIPNAKSIVEFYPIFPKLVYNLRG
jgi:hypothetical protein